MTAAPKRPELHVNVSVPQMAKTAAAMPFAGVGLMRAEFLCLQAGRHPALLLEEGGEEQVVAFFRDGLREVAAAFHPRPVTYRASDLKSNEYGALEGGERFEPKESNPMLGRRGAYRYLCRPAEFALELRALREVREEGFDRVRLMVPFVRTVAELRDVRALVDEAGLIGQPGFELWAMAEVPAAVLLAEEFAAEVDGVSIGTNDLTQLVLGADRDSPELAERYRASDPAVLAAVRAIVEGAHRAGRRVSICGDAASIETELLDVLFDAGIDSVSVVASAFAEVTAVLDARCAAPAGR